MTGKDFRPDRDIYLRDHVVMTAIAMGGAMAVLWLAGNPHVWTGAVAGFAAIAIRGWYMASEELGRTWEIRDGALRCGKLVLPLPQVDRARPLLSSVQVVTRTGDKHLIKYLKDPAGVAAAITEARA